VDKLLLNKLNPIHPCQILIVENNFYKSSICIKIK
jgi:hypothetical protein